MSEELRKLNDDLGQPSATKLLVAARKKGLQVTKVQILELQESGVRAIFAKPVAQKGAIATNDENGVFQADLADLTQYSSKNNKDHSYFLLVVDVFRARSIQNHSNQKNHKRSGEPLTLFWGDLGRSPLVWTLTMGMSLGIIFNSRPKGRASWSKRKKTPM